MSSRRTTGTKGEDMAASFLSGIGYAILDRNVWVKVPGCGRREIDLLCRDGDTLVFVEVKLRSRGAPQRADEAVTPAKRTRLEEAALAYLALHPELGETPVRIDVVAITRGREGSEVRHIKNITV